MEKLSEKLTREKNMSKDQKLGSSATHQALFSAGIAKSPRREIAFSFRSI